LFHPEEHPNAPAINPNNPRRVTGATVGRPTTPMVAGDSRPQEPYIPRNLPRISPRAPISFSRTGQPIGNILNEEKKDTVGANTTEIDEAGELAAAYLQRMGYPSDQIQRFLGQIISEERQTITDGVDSEPTELCEFCVSRGRPSCFGCLAGRGSRRVVNLRGNVHGFNST
jgi:hypothetical protein